MGLKNRKKVLVIDDDHAMRECIGFFLEDAGFSVTVCADGTDGVNKYQTEMYDLVITDIMMPGKDGLAAFIEMQKINPDVRVIAISGVDMRDALLNAASVFGAVNTVRKPFSREDLMAAVASAFDKTNTAAAAAAQA